MGRQSLIHGTARYTDAAGLDCDTRLHFIPAIQPPDTASYSRNCAAPPIRLSRCRYLTGETISAAPFTLSWPVGIQWTAAIQLSPAGRWGVGSRPGAGRTASGRRQAEFLRSRTLAHSPTFMGTQSANTDTRNSRLCRYLWSQQQDHSRLSTNPVTEKSDTAVSVVPNDPNSFAEVIPLPKCSRFRPS